MARAGEWCPEHRDGWDDCTHLHSRPMPPRLTLADVPTATDLEDHGPDCLCPDPACRDWLLTDAGRRPYPAGPIHG